MKPVLASYALVPNRASARLYRSLGPGVAPELVRHFDHPEGRLKSSEINTDKARRGSDSARGRRKHAFTPNQGPVARVARDFANQLAKGLDNARKNYEYHQLALNRAPANAWLLARSRRHADAWLGLRRDRQGDRAGRCDASAQTPRSACGQGVTSLVPQTSDA
jgi:hypothetical protein